MLCAPHRVYTITGCSAAPRLLAGDRKIDLPPTLVPGGKEEINSRQFIGAVNGGWRDRRAYITSKLADRFIRQALGVTGHIERETERLYSIDYSEEQSDIDTERNRNREIERQEQEERIYRERDREI